MMENTEIQANKCDRERKITHQNFYTLNYE